MKLIEFLEAMEIRFSYVFLSRTRSYRSQTDAKHRHTDNIPIDRQLVAFGYSIKKKILIFM